MDYTLNTKEKNTKTDSVWQALRGLWPLVEKEKGILALSFVAIIVNSAMNLLGPYILGYTINHFIIPKQAHEALVYSGILLVVYIIALIANYAQVRLMGGVSQRMLYTLRQNVFTKLSSLPVAFFNQNKAGDLISRINNDTDKLNQFFSQSLMQFVGNLFLIVGAGIFMLSITPKLGLVALIPAVFLLVISQLTSGFIKRTNLASLQANGLLSAEIQESLDNFKVVVAFDRRDYFREKFEKANVSKFITSVRAGIANIVLAPVFDFASNVAQLLVIAFGIYLITIGDFTIGFLISYLSYTGRFYDPLRQMASLWSSLQTALAGWDRISAILNMDTNLVTLPVTPNTIENNSVLNFDHVSFHYPDGETVLKDISFSLEKGKTYALVGPTGGGKTTTASLMARLFDPSEGTIQLAGRDIRTYTNAERTAKIGFILQEPFLFTGTLRDNLTYGNLRYEGEKMINLEHDLEASGLGKLIARFEGGLETKVTTAGSLSLGERQIIAFMRAVLRKPDILILDEATANIDTVTEKLLQEILDHLPETTTRVVIAHRLNTIENADEIFFVNAGTLTAAGSMEHALELLLHGKRTS